MAVIDGERRVVAVLMADVAGSTAIGERLGPERSKFLFDEVMRLMTREIERFDGTVAQLLGDGLLAMFGAPVAHEDDSELADVRDALERVADGIGEIVSVTGEPGIGKTRIVLDASDAVRDRVRILEG